MEFTVENEDGPRVVWNTYLPPINGSIMSPDFNLSGSICNLEFWRANDSERGELWFFNLLKSGESGIFKNGCIQVLLPNEISRFRQTDCLITVELNPTEVRISCILLETRNPMSLDDEVKPLFVFRRTIFPDIEKGIIQDVHKPCTESLVADLQKLLEGDSHDLQLKCENKFIPAHKSILSARSTVFEAMLRNDMQERLSGVVDITDMEFPVLQHFVRYIYCGTLPELTVELACGLFKAGDKYDVKALVKRCVQFLLKSLTIDTACEFLALADDHSHQEFKESIMTYILDKHVPKNYNGWIQFSHSRPMLGIEVLNRYVFRN